jgi:hypothetical protein
MAAILRVGPTRLWTPNQTKPVGVPKINWQHPLAFGLISYWFSVGTGRPVDLVLNRQSINDASALSAVGAATPYGQAGAYTGANQSSHDPANFPVQSWAHPYSCAAGFYQIGSATVTSTPGYFGVVDATGNDAFMLYNPSATTFGLSIANNSPANNFTFANNTFYVVVGATTGASSWNCWVNGVAQTAGALSTTFAGTNIGVEFGATSLNLAGPGFTNAVTFWGAIWNRQLSQAEAILLYTDPYCFLLPPESSMPALAPVVVSVVTSGTSFTVPADYGSLVSIECIAGGANGGAANANVAAGSPGGAGAYAKITSASLTANTAYTIQIGAISTNTSVTAPSSSAIGDPANTGMKDNSGNWVVAAQAGAAGFGVTGVGGLAGTAANSIGTTKNSGGAGGTSSVGAGNQAGGGGGGAGGPNAAGATGQNSVTTTFGKGGQGDGTFGGLGGQTTAAVGAAGTELGGSGVGAGGGGAGANGGANNGGNAGNYGAGGGGGGSSSVGAGTRGSGAPGVLIFTYTKAVAAAALGPVNDLFFDRTRLTQPQHWNLALPPVMAAVSVPGLNNDPLFDTVRKNLTAERWDTRPPQPLPHTPQESNFRLWEANRKTGAPSSWENALPPAFATPDVIDRQFDLPRRLRSAEWSADLPPAQAAAAVVTTIPDNFDLLFEPGRRLKPSEFSPALPPAQAVVVTAIPDNFDLLFEPGRRFKPSEFSSASLPPFVAPVVIDRPFDLPRRLRGVEWTVDLPPAQAVVTTTAVVFDRFFDNAPRPSPSRGPNEAQGPFRTAIQLSGFIGAAFDPPIRLRVDQGKPGAQRQDFGTGPYQKPPFVAVAGFIGPNFDPPMRIPGAVTALGRRAPDQAFQWSFIGPTIIVGRGQEITDTTILQLPIDAILAGQQDYKVSEVVWDIRDPNPKYKVNVESSPVKQLSDKPSTFTTTTTKKGYD